MTQRRRQVLRHGTIVSNSAVGSRGGLQLFNGPVTISHCLIAGNTASTGPDVFTESSPVTSEFNLVRDGAGSGLANGANGNLVGTAGAPIDPRLGSLRNHGGSTRDPTNSNRGLGLKGDFTVSVWIVAKQSNAWNIVLGNTGAGVAGTLHFGLANMRPHFGFYNNDLFGGPLIPLNPGRTWPGATTPTAASCPSTSTARSPRPPSAAPTRQRTPTC